MNRAHPVIETEEQLERTHVWVMNGAATVCACGAVAGEKPYARCPSTLPPREMIEMPMPRFRRSRR